MHLRDKLNVNQGDFSLRHLQLSCMAEIGCNSWPTVLCRCLQYSGNDSCHGCTVDPTPQHFSSERHVGASHKIRDWCRGEVTMNVIAGILIVGNLQLRAILLLGSCYLKQDQCCCGVPCDRIASSYRPFPCWTCGGLNTILGGLNTCSLWRCGA